MPRHRIRFRIDMLQAIKAGRKTATRRPNRYWLKVKEGDVLLAYLNRYGSTEVRLRMTRDAYTQPLSQMDWQDALAEGMHDPRRAMMRTDPENGPLAAFKRLWDELNDKKPGMAWADDPESVVLEFEIEEIIIAAPTGEEKTRP